MGGTCGTGLIDRGRSASYRSIVLWLSAVLIAAVSNLDNLVAGVALGLRGTRITLAPNVLIAGVTMAGTAGAIASGHALARLLQPSVAGSLGAVIIASIGVMTVVASRSPVREPAARMYPLRGPSGMLSWREAALLAIALSLNNVGTGVGAGIAGIPQVMTTALAGGFSIMCVGGGSRIGRVAGPLVGRHARLVAGLGLVCLGGAMLAGVG
ncbi:MAG: manganese efflux pump [Solirubrobacterales bacterium]|nr:manganese efflux pump [Solirubrobacterales bacterium]